MLQHTPVLVIGGSLVGLSAALFLGWRGVPAVVVEKHRGSSPHPRATGFTELTLEHFRAVGIADQIPQIAAGSRLRRVSAESLVGIWHEELPWTPGEMGAFGDRASPCAGAAIAQDKLEPILRAAARGHGIDLRLGTELLSFEQGVDGVVACIRNRDTDVMQHIRADYMIAADGADSAVREALGIPRKGAGHLRILRSVLFRCAEAEAWLNRGVQQFQIEQPGFRAFMTSYGDGRWVLMFDDDREPSDAELAANVKTALGRDMAIEVLTSGRWEMAGRIAERYSEGRVFLAGDAAHQLPPTRGGFGANTGIDDAWNLAWKLEWVTRGWSTPALLDSYDEERQPIGWLRHQQTFARPDYAHWAGNALKDEVIYGNDAMELGQLSRSNAIIGTDVGLPPAAHPEEWAGQPGTRAPHLWVNRASMHISTIDLFTRHFVLISQDSRWTDAATAVASRLGITIEAILLGQDVSLSEPEAFLRQFGLLPEGACLVRPDGIVAWRSRGPAENREACISDVIARVAALPKRSTRSEKRPSTESGRQLDFGLGDDNGNAVIPCHIRNAG